MHVEKVIYVVWRQPADAIADFNARLMGPIANELERLGAVRLQINVVDDAVEEGAVLRLEPMRPSPDAMIAFWLNAAHDRLQCEQAIEAACGRIAGYAVAESTVLPGTDTPGAGGRIRGFSQLAFIYKKPGLGYDGFLDIWMRDQTIVGPATQDTFYYCQNIVTRALTVGAPAWDGIVEEWYPEAAMTDPLVYWKANGSEELQKTHYKREIDNITRFLDLEATSAIITSAYRFGGWSDQKR